MQTFYFTDKNLSVVRSIDRKAESLEQNMHMHDCYELYCLISGECEMIIEGAQYRLSPFDVVLLRPNEAHLIKCGGDTPYERIAVHFKPDIFGEIADKNLLRPFLQRHSGD